MRRLKLHSLLLPSILLALAGQGAQAYDYTAPVTLHTIAQFDPTNSVVPFPTDLLRQGSTDLTLNIPISSSTPAGEVAVYNALNALDGFSTNAPWTTTFSAQLDPSTVVAGQTVHVYQVSLTSQGAVDPTQPVTELPATAYVATLASNTAAGATLAIVPLVPLKQLTSYMAVLTNGITDASGVPVRQSLIYGFAKRTNPLCVNGATTFPVLTSAEACALEPLRELTNLQEAAAATQGVDPADIVLSWTATTQSTTVTMQAVTGLVDAAPNQNIVVVPIGKTIADLGIPNQQPIADVYVGAFTLPYYLSAPSTANPVAPLTNYWTAPPCGQVATCSALGLDPTSTNVTAANPLPAWTSNQTVPVLLTVPNAGSGLTKPASGWPVVIYQHGITRNRTDMLAIAGALTQAGYAVIAIDLPLHGLTDPTNLFYDNQLLAGSPAAGLITGERTFDLGTQNPQTGALAPPIASSGTYFINLTSLRTSRDNLREGVADLLSLRSSLPYVRGTDGTPLFDTARVGFAGQSLGSIEGTTFMSLASTPNTAVQNALLNVPGGGITGLLLGSPSFAPLIVGGLAQAGITPGTSAFNTFLVATQTVIDSGDPINYAGDAGTGAVLASKNLLAQEVVGGSAPLAGDISAANCPTCYDANGNWLPDQVIPNTVINVPLPGGSGATITSPLSGGTPLISLLGLPQLTTSTQGAPFHGVVRFVAGTHGSLLDPTESPQTTVEMQTEMASFFGSGGAAVQITNPAVVQQQ
jgi:pimeloyl-ACP methyl ester carboxylesterase